MKPLPLMFSWEIYKFFKTAEKVTRSFLEKNPATLLKKRLQHRYFPVKIAKLFRTPILKNICERLLLKQLYSKEQ